MNEMTRIAVDAVGGDFGAPVVLEGVEMALAEDPNLEVVICGPADAKAAIKAAKAEEKARRKAENARKKKQ